LNKKSLLCLSFSKNFSISVKCMVKSKRKEAAPMPVLPDYEHFHGRHPETGSVHNILSYQGVSAPHTGKPYSEAMLLGVSGGIAFGYFTFAYEGYDPILSLLTRNTFDPLQTLLERLGIRQDLHQTNRASAGEANLLEALSNGRPVLVWADVFSLPYYGLAHEEKNWDMQPVVVYGYQDGMAYLAGPSKQPLIVPAEALTTARARVKKDKFRVVTLDAPDERKLPSAVQQGIRQCLQLYTEKPPKGARDNFGFAAFDKWAAMLVNTRNPHGWSRLFPPVPALLAALAGNAYLPGAYGWIVEWGTRPNADRDTYADFLDEAAKLLDKPELAPAAAAFRESAARWGDLAQALLPESVPLLFEARRLKDRRRQLLLESGMAVVEEIREINRKLGELREESLENFPLKDEALGEFLAEIKECVVDVRDAEQAAVDLLREGMARSR
jgi:hypothetical protein